VLFCMVIRHNLCDMSGKHLSTCSAPEKKHSMPCCWSHDLLLTAVGHHLKAVTVPCVRQGAAIWSSTQYTFCPVQTFLFDRLIGCF
jgi:hypothetical protein